MSHTIVPTLDEVREKLRHLNLPGIRELAQKSGRPATTINRIKYGEIKEPGFETVRAFLPFLEEVAKVEAHQSRDFRREQKAQVRRPRQKADAA